MDLGTTTKRRQHNRLRATRQAEGVGKCGSLGGSQARHVDVNGCLNQYGGPTTATRAPRFENREGEYRVLSAAFDDVRNERALGCYFSRNAFTTHWPANHKVDALDDYVTRPKVPNLDQLESARDVLVGGQDQLAGLLEDHDNPGGCPTR